MFASVRINPVDSTDRNYREALDLLKERFGDNKLLQASFSIRICLLLSRFFINGIENPATELYNEAYRGGYVASDAIKMES